MEAHFERVLDDSIEKKRPADDRHEASAASKRPRNATLSKQAMDALLAEAEHRSDLAIVDAKAFKTMISSLEKKIKKNAMQRSKYADQPEKFMESEIALDDELTKWKDILATSPQLYGPLMDDPAILPMVLGLFAHENLDIRLDVVKLLAEMLDIDDSAVSDEQLEAAERLVKVLMQHNVFEMLVPLLLELEKKQMDDKQDEEDEEADNGIYQVLQIMENAIDLVPESSIRLSSPSLMEQLLQCIAPKRPWSGNKLYASEILSIIVQADPVPRQVFLKSSSSMDQLLQVLAPYRKRDPNSEEEEEFVENLLNALCSLLMEVKAQTIFRRLEGLELMLRCLQAPERYVFHGATRVIDHALMNHARNCERYVEIGGLRALFAMFMGKKAMKSKSKRSKTEQKAWKLKQEEHVINILCSLCRWLRKDAPNDVYERFHAKFLENEMEKMDRLIDLYAKHGVRMDHTLATLPEADDEEEDPDAMYLRRLDAGLFIVQRIAFVIAHNCGFTKKLRAYVVVKCHERNIDMDRMARILQEQASMITIPQNDDSTKEQDEKDELERLIAAMEHEPTMDADKEEETSTQD